MAKLHEVKTKVTFRPKITIEDGAFDVNICPVCGGEIRDVEVHSVAKEGVFRDLHYRYAEIECPECGAGFEKTVYDNYEKKTLSEIFLNISVAIFVLALIGAIAFGLLVSVIPNVTLIAEATCLAILTVVGVGRLFIED